MTAPTVVMGWNPEDGGRAQLMRERRSFLVEAGLKVVLCFQLVSLFLFVVTVQHLHSLFTGAMCAAGTLNANSHGYPTLAAKVAVFVTDPEHRQVSTADVLRALYSLSPAESELVQLLSSGHSLDEAARIRHVTMNTVKTQLKRVFAKTKTSGQADLVQMVLTGVSAVQED